MSSSVFLAPESVIRRREEIDLTLEMNGDVSVHVGEQSLRVGSFGLPILHEFTRPISLREGLTRIARYVPSRIALDDLVLTVRELISIGALQLGNAVPTISERFYPFGFYDSPGVQLKILNDCERRSAFLAAITETVRPGDVVIDLGTGNGILGVAAARAGARRVYAIEPSRIADAAARIADVNGVSNILTIVSGWSHLLELPEPADVLLFDIVGSEPLEMRIIEATIDALARHLKPDARILPQAVHLDLVLASTSTTLREQHIYTESVLTAWREWYGMDFTPLAETQPAMTPVSIDPAQIKEVRALSARTRLWSIDLARAAEHARFSATADMVINEPGLVDAVVGVVSLQLSDAVRFSADPWKAGSAPHWMVPMWLASNRRTARAGDRLTVRYDYLGRGRSRVTIAEVST